MPDQSSAANEHAILQEITAPLATLPDDPVPLVADVEFPVVLRGYDRIAVDAYVKRTSQLVAELQASRSPEAAIRRALERVGEQISGILRRAHETAEEITSQSRREAEDRLDVARQEAAAIVSSAQQRLKELDGDTDRIWAERHRIVDDTRGLAHELLMLAESAAEKFPAADEPDMPGGEAAGGEALGQQVPVIAEPAGVPEPGADEEAPAEMEHPDVDGEAPDADPEAHAAAREPSDDEDDPSKEFDPDATAVMPPYRPPADTSGPWEGWPGAPGKHSGSNE